MFNLKIGTVKVSILMPCIKIKVLAGLGFASAKPSVSPRSKNPEFILDFYSLRRSAEPSVLIMPI